MVSARVEADLKQEIEKTGLSVRQLLWRAVNAEKQHPEYMRVLQELRDDMRNVRTTLRVHDRELQELLKQNR